jgi:hypothetical protein
MMTEKKNYTSPTLELIEVEVEQGFILSGVEAPDFKEENVI